VADALRTTGKVCETFDAKDLWRSSPRRRGLRRPGRAVRLDDQPLAHLPEHGRINASNPCSEYMFLDDSACNLASVNLTKFLRDDDGSFDVDGYRHACRVFFIAQEILVDLSSYPTTGTSRRTATTTARSASATRTSAAADAARRPVRQRQGARDRRGAHRHHVRPRRTATSAEMAGVEGAVRGFAKNREPMLRVMNMHRDAAYAIDRDVVPEPTCIAPRARTGTTPCARRGTATATRRPPCSRRRGTIGLLMDCDTTGIEPDFALVKFKKLAGGGYFKIVNQSVPPALRRLGYSEREVQEIVAFVSRDEHAARRAAREPPTLKEKGLHRRRAREGRGGDPGCLRSRERVRAWVLGEETYERSARRRSATKKGFSLLEHLGFSRAQIDEASDVIVGRMTIEGAPHLRRSTTRSSTARTAAARRASASSRR
jgi:ribonucleoside-diphosphate reductase alpha chain